MPKCLYLQGYVWNSIQYIFDWGMDDLWSPPARTPARTPTLVVVYRMLAIFTIKWQKVWHAVSTFICPPGMYLSMGFLFEKRYSHGICAVDVCFIRCLVRYISVTYASSWYTNGRLPDMYEYEPHEYRRGNGYVPNKTDWERTTNWQPPAGEFGCPFAILNIVVVVEHAQNSSTDMSDIIRHQRTCNG